MISEFIKADLEDEQSESSPNLYLKVLAMTWLRRRSFGFGAKETFIKSKRKWRCTGLEHVPGMGPYIIAANHFARMDDLVRMTGPQKMNDFIGAIGLINKLVEEHSSSSQILWTPSLVPRPEALAPKGKSFTEIIKWLRNDAIFMGSNISRKLFLSMFSYSKDILMVPSKMDNCAGFRQFYVGVTNHLKARGVLGIFPEGEISCVMQQAKPGIAHIAIRTHTPVLPLALYDENGVLNISVGPFIEPPSGISKKYEFIDLVMCNIAIMLPEKLRGHYADTIKNLKSI
jgi:1-acyl-sn-glycerol-3-phosphate acyltransferase